MLAQSLQETKSSDRRTADRVTLMKTVPTTNQAGRTEKSLHLPVPTGLEKNDRLVACFEL